MLVIYYHVTNYSKIQQLKTTKFIISVSVGQECERSLAGCLWLKVSCETTVKFLSLWLGLLISRIKRCEGWDLHSCGCWQASVPLQVGLPVGLPLNMVAGFLQDNNARESKIEHPNQKPLSFYNLTSEVTSHHFFHTLFIRSESVSLTQSQGERITQECKYQEPGIIGDQFRLLTTVAYKQNYVNAFLPRVTKVHNELGIVDFFS